jgi:hypothetical protein
MIVSVKRTPRIKGSTCQSAPNFVNWHSRYGKVAPMVVVIALVCGPLTKRLKSFAFYSSKSVTFYWILSTIYGCFPDIDLS